MSALLIVFAAAILVLFLGISKPESAMKWPSVILLLLAGAVALSGVDLATWLTVPESMISYSSMDRLFVALLCGIGALVIAVFDALSSKGSDRRLDDVELDRSYHVGRSGEFGHDVFGDRGYVYSSLCIGWI